MRKLKTLISKAKSFFLHIESQQYLIIEELQHKKEFQEANSLIPYGFRVYSQNDEDGILQEIFLRIGFETRIFVEFGVGDGLENNTLYLLLQGWKGLWIEGDKKNSKKIVKGLKRIIDERQLIFVKAFVSRENINTIISANIIEAQIDLLSIDIDGNDYHLFDAIKAVEARVVVIEYNAKFKPPMAFCVNYDPKQRWKGDDYFGASLKFLEIQMKKKNYSLVACSLSGTNAFFVKTELLQKFFLAPHTAEKHYQPQRYSLRFCNSYPHSYRSLVKTYEAMKKTATFMHKEISPKRNP